jgi:hypothetical protein
MLAPLAILSDLVDRHIDVTDAALANEMLAVASAAVRGAAGSPISETTSTITYSGWLTSRYLGLVGQPVTAVSAVTINGAPVSDWRLADGRLWRPCGWGVDNGPAEVIVTQTHGLPVVPRDLVDLVCAFAGAGIAAAAEGFASSVGKVAERIGDYSVTYAEGAAAVAAVMQVPEGTRRWLASMFGGSAAMVSTRS